MYTQRFYPDTIQPRPTGNKSGLYPINTPGIRQDLGSNRQLADGCWVSSNPRTFDQVRAIWTEFDAPNYTGAVNVGNVCHDEIYSKQYDQYGKRYNSYMDINAGSITYYIDDSQMDAYNEPNFTTPSKVIARTFVDPMGVAKPEYNRIPQTAYAWNKRKCGSQSQYDACDSYTHDTLEFRQGLMAMQMQPQNQRDWVLRWGDTVLDKMGAK